MPPSTAAVPTPGPRGRPLSLSTRAALGTALVGPLAILVGWWAFGPPNPVDVVIVYEEVPASAPPVNAVSTDDADEAEAAPVAAPEVADQAPSEPEALPSPQDRPPAGWGVAPVTAWGLVLTVEGESDWARGRLSAAAKTPWVGEGLSVTKEVEIAKLPAAMTAALGRDVIAYGPAGAVCRARVGSPRLVAAHNGWQDMLPGLDEYADPDTGDYKAPLAKVRQATWASVEQPWLVASLTPLDPSESCEGALVVVDAGLGSQGLAAHDHKHDHPAVADQVRKFLATADLRQQAKGYEAWRSERIEREAAWAGEDPPPVPVPTWKSYVKDNLQVRTFGPVDAPVALAIELSNKDAASCGDDWWESARAVYRRGTDGEWTRAYTGWPDALVEVDGRWVDASRATDLSVGTVIRTDTSDDKSAVYATWDFSGCPC